MASSKLKPAIQTVDLGKQFNRSQSLFWVANKDLNPIPAVGKTNLSIGRGELFGLLGPNGAGKTTLVKMLATLILPTSGNAIVNGFELSQEQEIKSSIGLSVADERSFFWRLTIRQNLEFFLRLHHTPASIINTRISDVLEKVGLTKYTDQQYRSLSSGLRQRCSLGRAFVNNPSILFLDEPTRGLDPTSAGSIQDLISDLIVKNPYLTVFLTTHDLYEAERICHRIAIMDRGIIRACGTMKELRNEISLGDTYQIIVDWLPESISDELDSSLDVSVESTVIASEEKDNKSNKLLKLETRFGDGKLANLIDLLNKNQVKIEVIDRIQIPLDKIFQRYTSEHPEEDDRLNQSMLQTKSVPILTTEKSKSRRSYLFNKTDFRISMLTAFLKRDLITERSYPLSFVLQILGIFFQVGVFYYISLLLGDQVAPFLSQYGGDYFNFVLLGIALSGYLGVGLSSFANRLRQTQTNGTLEAMLTTPNSVSIIIIHSSLWDFITTTFRLFIYMALGVLLSGSKSYSINLGAQMLVFSLTIIAFSSLGILASSFIMVLKRGDPITWVINGFSYLLGGVYFPISILPDWLQVISKFLPITYSLEALRYSILSGYSLYELLPYLLPLIGFCIFLFPLSLFTFRFAVKRARIDGSLTHY